MLELRNVKIKIDKETNYDLDYFLKIGKELIEKKTHQKVDYLTLSHKTIDARKKDIYFVLSYLFKLKKEKQVKDKNIFIYKENPDYLNLIKLKDNKDKINKNVVVVGMGPAGLFSSLVLVNSGFKVTLIEQGKKVEDRIKDIEKLEKEGKLNPKSNVQFGEGGAGTFSDGKLSTGISSPYIKYIFETFVDFGGNPDLLYEAYPHVGSDVLRKVLINFRNHLINKGVDIHFETELIDFDDKYVYTNKETFPYDELILATGHSAISIYKLLEKKNILMKPKNFSIGVRIEHLQKDISKLQYHDDYPNLPPANYKIVNHLKSGRSMYSFCMCPGGVVINSTSDEKRLVTNGMSLYKRDSVNANSALLINVNVEDYYHGNIFDGYNFQKQIEEKAYNDNLPYYYPVETLGSFLYDKENEIKKIIPSIKPGYYLTKIKDILPDYLTISLKEGLLNLKDILPDYVEEDAIMTLPETRSSSTITVVRDDDLQSTRKNLYFAGEGGGHAGGITSSAVDGIKIALKIKEKYQK